MVVVSGAGATSMFPPGTNNRPVSEVVVDVVVVVSATSTWSVETITFWNAGRIGAGTEPELDASTKSNVVGP